MTLPILGDDFDLLYSQRLQEQQPKQTIFRGQEAVDRLNEQIASQPRTIAMDFDGVLAEWNKGDNINKIGKPLAPGIKLARRIQAKGFRLVILTARPKPMWGAIESWLKKYGVHPLQVTNVKPPAEAYIDDRAIRYPANLGAKKTKENSGDGIMNGLDGNRIVGSLDTGNRRTSR